jgi:hypothetical protein
MMNEDPNACPLIYDWIELSDLMLMLHLTRNTLKEWCAEGDLVECIMGKASMGKPCRSPMVGKLFPPLDYNFFFLSK